MALCSFYHDAKSRIYYLPQDTVRTYQNDPKPHRFPQGCIKLSTCDKRSIYVLKDYPYPEKVKASLAQIHKLSEQDACAELASLQATHIDPVMLDFTRWFMQNHEDGLFKTAVAERAFFARDCKLLELTMNKEFVPFNEDVVQAIIEGRYDIIKVVNRYQEVDRMMVIEGALYANNRSLFDMQASLVEIEGNDVEGFYKKVLELGCRERYYERAKSWVWARGYKLCHPSELP